MNTELEEKRWNPPWGLRISAAIGALVGLGVLFLTTISHGLKESLYAAFGSFCIVFGVLLLCWIVVRYGKEEGW
jgi:hypothetical protein